jgi:hypothetical protein
VKRPKRYPGDFNINKDINLEEHYIKYMIMAGWSAKIST